VHFREEDFVTKSEDKLRKYRSSSSKKLSNKYLNQDAVPSIFPGLPSYLTQEPSKAKERPTSSATSGARLLKEHDVFIQAQQEFQVSKYLLKRTLLCNNCFVPFLGYGHIQLFEGDDREGSK
jgi:hypothetical protein